MIGEWIAMEQWAKCAEMAKPGIVFEIRNAQDQWLLTPCVSNPPVPFDWKSPPVKFRAITEPKPEHSAPLPPPPKS